MSSRALSAFALCSVALAPSSAWAEQARTSSVPIYSLVQVTVNAASVGPEDFKARTEAIRSCDDARKLAKDLGTEANHTSSVMATLLPPQLQPILEDTQTGRATPVLIEEGSALHVFVVCNRS